MLLAPFLILILPTFLIGLANGIVQSLGYMPFMNMNTLTLEFYREVLNDKDFYMSLLYSIYISAVSSVISVVLGVAAAFAILGSRKEHKLHMHLSRVPVIIPHLVSVVLVLIIFSQTGLVSRLMHSVGLITDPNRFPLMVFDRLGIGIILVYLYKQIPYVALTVHAVLRNIKGDYTEAAFNLGAGRRETLFKVVLPMLLPSILSAFLMIFAFSFGAFEVPYLVGSPAISALPVKAYVHYTDPDFTSRSYTMVINVIISVFSIFFIWLYTKVFKKVARYGL